MPDDQPHAIIHIKISDSEEARVDDLSHRLLAQLVEMSRITGAMELMAVTFTNLTQAFKQFAGQVGELEKQGYKFDGPMLNESAQKKGAST